VLDDGGLNRTVAPQLDVSEIDHESALDDAGISRRHGIAGALVPAHVPKVDSPLPAARHNAYLARPRTENRASHPFARELGGTRSRRI
jgi:hypothetical protein